jgi:hypothetical protein
VIREGNNMRTKISRKNIYTLLGIIVTALLITSISSCGSDLGMQPEGNYISGYAIFVDTNFIHGDGYYAIALYGSGNSPYSTAPLQTSRIEMVGKLNPYYYRITWDGSGNCYGAIVWMNNNNNPPLILGTYGCDTNRNCSNHKVISFPNYTGANYNIICYADTTRKLY